LPWSSNIKAYPDWTWANYLLEMRFGAGNFTMVMVGNELAIVVRITEGGNTWIGGLKLYGDWNEGARRRYRYCKLRTRLRRLHRRGRIALGVIGEA
jgi:hypothetical protein